MFVTNDNDVMSMFSRNYRHSEFDLFVEIAKIVANDDGDEGGDSESGDKEEQGSGDGEGNDDEDDGMSDYCSDDHCEIFNESDEEFVDDHLKGCLNGDAVEFPNATGRKIVFEKGMIFTDVDALREFVIQEGFRMKRYRNETQRVTAGCDVKGSSWRIHASPLGDGVTFQIKTYSSVHTCIRSDTIKDASAKWMASKLVNILRDNISMDVKAIRIELKKFGINPPYMQIYRAQKKALEEIEGGHAESFAKLPYHAHMVSVTNEGSIATLQCDIHDDGSSSSIHVAPSFKKFCLGLSALRDGFITGCNPFIKFDGCHLKGPFGGVLLATIGLDGNNGLFPIAFGITEMKCKENWLFFFENLSNLLGGFSHDRPWTFMSDRQKAARSYDVVGFNFAMYKVKELKPAAYDWLLKIPVEQWSRHAFDPRLKNDHVTNNIMLNDARDESRNCKLLVAGQFQFEVQDGNVHYVERYMGAYSYFIHPIPDLSFWPQDVDVNPTSLKPPISKRLPRRPKRAGEKNQEKQLL
ncbi:UNVERIFIED_CONTAM: hypothetical protein Scaly_1662400 [Sesamum calycinum]|uniref:MULE transposase domain-containing protein n=1 Tax=Sesamum calycinum TaxID=2727403 RepID=A0AAW2NV40_9LAMI